MQLPNMQTHDYYHYWKPVENGVAAPDEWQAALMALVEKAESEGVFYSKDMDAYVRANADFVPPDFWGYQTSTPTEGGKMGMEIYCARNALENAKILAENTAALSSLKVGQLLGSLVVNGKVAHKCKIIAIDGFSVTFRASLGSTLWDFNAPARAIKDMQARYQERKGKRP